MPTHVVFELEDVSLERFNGRDVHGAVLDAVKQIHEPLATSLHEGGGGRAWSVSWDVWGEGRVGRVRLWLSLLRDEDAQALMAHGWRCPTPQVRLGGRAVVVERVLVGVAPGLEIPCDRLGERLEEAADVVLTLLTPTFFRDGGEGFLDVVRLAVSPERVLGGALSRVKGLGLQLPGEEVAEPWRYVSELRCALETRRERLHWGDAGKRVKEFIGVVGEVRWRLMAKEPAQRRFVLALLDFAHFAGLGSRTAMGFGACKVEGRGGRYVTAKEM